MRTKYEKLLMIAVALLTAAEARTGKDVLAKAIGTLLHDGYGDTLKTVVETYKYPVGDDLVDCPADVMASAYCNHVYAGGPKPEWLKHAGL
jgi:hypothetical protein